MSLGSRAAFFTWRLYRTSALARRFLEPVIRRSAEKGLARHDGLVESFAPSDAWATPRPSSDAALFLTLPETPTLESRRLVALLNHWGARYAVAPARSPWPGVGLAAESGARSARVVFGSPTDADSETMLDALRDHPIARRARLSGPLPAAVARLGVSVSEQPFRRVVLDPGALAPSFVASPWGSLVADSLDWACEKTDWRDPLPPLVSARIDDVSGEKGLAWLRAFEDQGVRPSIGTLHDRWLAGPSVAALVAATRRGCSVSPHAFDMDRFIWFHAHAARPFAKERMEEHRAKIARDVAATGLVLGKTLNCHFDVFGESALEAAKSLGFEFLLGEHRVGQDWRERPRARDPLGTPLYCYERAGSLVAFQAEGAIASSASKRSRYDWLRNFLAVDRRTNLPIKESLDRKGAVRQGVDQLVSALHAGFPGYLLAHELHLDVLGPDLLGELLSDVLREAKEIVPSLRTAAFDELPAACARRTL